MKVTFGFSSLNRSSTALDLRISSMVFEKLVATLDICRVYKVNTEECSNKYSNNHSRQSDANASNKEISGPSNGKKSFRHSLLLRC